MQAGLNSFTLTPKQWTERTGAIGIQSKARRYGGTYAHLDIALAFAAWISIEFTAVSQPRAGFLRWSTSCTCLERNLGPKERSTSRST